MRKQKISVSANGYAIHIGDSVFAELNSFFTLPKYNSDYSGSKIFILADENSLKHCLPQLSVNVKRLQQAEILEIESGEQNKCIEMATELWKALSEHGANRKSLLVNIGGGVVGDLGGFVASTYMRGIDFINIPTTLLAQVDASVGGKVGIDLGNLKNHVGVFNNPQGVFNYPDFIKTLPKRQVLSGFAEIIKHGLIFDKKYWELIKNVDVSKISEMHKLIERSIIIKNNIVKEDPQENGSRKKLNFGHTVGHAIESYFLETVENPVLHGEAIAAGMICEAYLSVKKLKFSQQALQEITDFVLTLYKPIEISSYAEIRIIHLMQHDKKNEKNEINFTLLKEIGVSEVNKTASIELIKESFKYYHEQCAIK